MKTSGRISRTLALIGIAVLVLGLRVQVFAGNIDADLGAKEIKMGNESAAEVAKQSKLSDNAADLKRIRDIGQKLAAIANKEQISALYGSSKVTPFDYTFNIIEGDDVNAFSLPGGHIYIYRGLLKFIQSDQELAGVMAHEITHAAHHHMVFLLRKQAAGNGQLAIALLAAFLGGARSAGDLGTVLYGAQLVQLAKVNGFGMQAERDADHGGIIIAHEAGYNPVGLLTFLERLARRPELVDYGILRNHPLDAERVAAAKQGILDLGLPINRRETTNAIEAEVKTEKVNGADCGEVVLDGVVILRLAPVGPVAPDQRAKDIAGRINKALDSDLQIHELKVDPAGGVIGRDQALLTVTDDDAKLMGKTPDQIAQDAAAAIRSVILKQMEETVH